ncbi:hypothetical protein TWF225_002534 [Orbilia oligospora]|uniref:Uncharacterized protein n=1 Tax=Orbilia oligospora TaxID=2813651 RepID=A0A7C8PNT7_ORBOL|nr:hypothetical protein TWF751_004669 [Orbilia oligospora]KAF3190038.1 hypothetical protein TWF225_002534 [Orbilia oligospora]KAF3266222.1 hypothetical protein TWF217_001900 [Orbilia oligospora]KAF3268667.1 hypothetical protein TWF128_007039 [Orbilia oligospora]KAF3297125.1 hypothetical protein TWF132_008482 [Orbilia oligospora]
MERNEIADDKLKSVGQSVQSLPRQFKEWLEPHTLQKIQIRNSRSKIDIDVSCRVVVRLVAHICSEGRGVLHALLRQLAVMVER